MNNRLPLSLDLTIAVHTALSVGAGGASFALADKVVIRDGYNRLIVPGSHVKGRLRHACEEVARVLDHPVCESPRAETMCPQMPDPLGLPPFPRMRPRPDLPLQPCCVICQLFGSPTFPGPLRFYDLVYIDPLRGEVPGETDEPRLDQSPTIRPAVALDRRRRIVAEQRLFFQETTPAGLGLTDLARGPNPRGVFYRQRAIQGTVVSRSQAYLLLAGLAFLINWGGGGSRGLGWGCLRASGTVADQPLIFDALRDVPTGLEQLTEELKEL